MSSYLGKNLHVSIFGQSHAPAIGVTVDGLPAGERVDLEELDRFLQRRAPGRDATATPRKEADKPRILCGLSQGKTCGAPLAAMEIMNAKAEKDLRGSINRRVNCDAANLDKAVEAAMTQVESIRRLEEQGRLALLPEKLQETASLRLAHPEDTLSQLAQRYDPPITKSALNHRLRKLMEMARA